MSTRALIVPTVNLKPNPPPYGELRIRKGAWDQLQASRAYQQTLHDRDLPAPKKAALDLEI
jgi:hypothetical protein